MQQITRRVVTGKLPIYANLLWSARMWEVLGLVLALPVTFGFRRVPVAKNSQTTNGFKIGIFGFDYKPVQPYIWCEPAVSSGGYKSSQLDVLAQDGFNIVHDYSPNWSDQNMDSVLQLVAANGLKMLVESKQFYKPLPNGGIGSNDYAGGNMSGACDWKARPNYQTLIDNVYSKTANKDTVWGHQVTEEASYLHCFNYTDVADSYCGPNSVSVEVPPQNVFQAINDFRNRLNSRNIGHQKLIVMEANHFKSIHDNTDDGEGQYNPQDYLRGPVGSRPDVFFEGSYASTSGWQNQNYSDIKNNGPNDNWHYLGAFKSIDYGFLQVPEVHKVINIEGAGASTHHSDASIPNANWLWFQAYASIIHGADGVWFWSLPDSWKPGEKPPNWDQMADRYEPQNFPQVYRDWVAPLAKELRYLLNNNFLDTNSASVLHTKTDHPDDFCIVQSPASYISDPFHSTEQYGLRYTIRTNGQDVIIIVVNPLPIVVTTTFDFHLISNGVIANSTGVEVLFETNQDSPSGPTYKVSRNGRVDLMLNSAVTRPINYATGTKQFSDVFGPLDVHIYRFKKGSTTLPKPLWYHAALNWDAETKADGNLIVDSGTTQIFYKGSDKRIYTFWRDGNRWRDDALDYNAPANAAGNLVLDPSGNKLYYLGIDKRIYNYWWTGNHWQQDALDPNASANAAGNLVLDPSLDNLYYLGTDKRIYNYWWTGNHWQQDALDYNAPANAAGNLVVDPSGNQLYYLGIDKRIYNYWWTGNHWQQDALDFNASANAAGNLVLDPFGNQLYYLGIDKRIYNYWWTGNHWQQDALDPNASANAAGHLVLGPTPGKLYYLGTDKRIYNYWWNPSKPGNVKWQQDLLTPCALPLGAYDLVIDKFGQLFYVASDDQRVYTLYWSLG